VDNNFSLVFIDIDNFKNINDTKGHVFGDQVLKRLACILHEVIGLDGKVYRIAGDEFILIIPQSKIASVCNTIRDNVRKEGDFTISQGVVSINNSQCIFETINQADCAMYQAKTRGKDTICFADQELVTANLL
jgi:diguanylate cyclase (GGDEF)-like protein